MATKEEKRATLKGNKSSKVTKKYFGVALDPMSGEVPLLITRAIEFLSGWLYESGLFRISGQVNTISDLKAQWDRGLEPSLSGQAIPHNVSGLLKLYLRELPEPIFTFSRYGQLLKSGAIKDFTARLTETKRIIDSLPPTLFATTKAVVGLLHNVASFSHINNMKASNVSMVFSSNVIRPEVETIEYIVQDTPIVNGVFEFIIENYPVLYGVQPLPAPGLDSSQRKPGTTSSPAAAQTMGTPEQKLEPDPKQPRLSTVPAIGSSTNLMKDAAARLMANDDDLPAWARGGNAGAATAEAAAVPAKETAAAAEAKDEVWTFREGSYSVISELYELVNTISTETGNLRSVSELVFAAEFVWEARLGIGEEITVDIPPVSCPPLVMVDKSSTDAARLRSLLELHGKALRKYLDEIASYVEIVADQMSVIEVMEQLVPIDKRFRWLLATLKACLPALTGSGGIAQDGTAGASDSTIDTSILENFYYEGEDAEAQPEAAAAEQEVKAVQEPVVEAKPALEVKPIQPAEPVEAKPTLIVKPITATSVAPTIAPAAVPTQAQQPQPQKQPANIRPTSINLSATVTAATMAVPKVPAAPTAATLKPACPGGGPVPSPREAPKLTGNLLLQPIATLLEVLNLLKNDLVNVDTADQLLEHPLQNEAELLLLDASDQQDMGALNVSQAALAAIVEVAKLLKKLAETCKEDMPIADAHVAAHLIRSVTKLYIARDEMELTAIESSTA